MNYSLIKDAMFAGAIAVLGVYCFLSSTAHIQHAKDIMFVTNSLLEHVTNQNKINDYQTNRFNHQQDHLQYLSEITRKTSKAPQNERKDIGVQP